MRDSEIRTDCWLASVGLHVEKIMIGSHSQNTAFFCASFRDLWPSLEVFSGARAAMRSSSKSFLQQVPQARCAWPPPDQLRLSATLSSHQQIKQTLMLHIRQVLMLLIPPRPSQIAEIHACESPSCTNGLSRCGGSLQALSILQSKLRRVGMPCFGQHVEGWL